MVSPTLNTVKQGPWVYFGYFLGRMVEGIIGPYLLGDFSNSVQGTDKTAPFPSSNKVCEIVKKLKRKVSYFNVNTFIKTLK